MKRMLILTAIGGIALTAIACQLGEDAIALVPDGFQGEVLIFLERPYGEPPLYENGTHIYEIPPNGVLYSQFSPTSRFAKLTVYYVNKSGKRTPLPYIDRVDNVDLKTKAPVDSEQVYVYGAGYGYVHLNEGQSLKNVPGYGSGDTVKTFGIVLSRLSDWDSISWYMERQHSHLFDQNSPNK